MQKAPEFEQNAELPVDQMFSIWSNLDLKRRIILTGATTGMFLGVVLMAQFVAQPQLTLLYAGLDAASAGEVVASLEARGATVDVRGSAIYVDAAERDALRLTLAGEGLPKNSNQGYELLDTLTGFGTTSQMFDAAYWRAKEGELARTIASNRQFAAVRVHISNPTSDPFRQGRVDAASVSITMASGQVSRAQATAVRYLVASAIAGLTADKVSVIDSQHGLLPNGDDQAAQATLMSDRAEALRTSLTRLLEARVGVNRSVVEVTVEPVTEREEITERRFEPDSRVPISSDAEEITTTSTDQSNRGVTVASNLPDGEANASAGTSQSNETRTREIVNYEVSETQRAIIREPGSVRRISVAVLVDGLYDENQSGDESWQPRPQEELDDLRDLIASAIGFDASRGDMITVRSLKFLPSIDFSEPVPLNFLQRFPIDPTHVINITALTFLVIFLGIFVVRPLLVPGNNLGRHRTDATTALPLGGVSTDPSLVSTLPALDGEIDVVDDFSPLGDLPKYESLQSPSDPAGRLQELIEQKQDETVEVLSNWMNEAKEPSR